MASLTCFNRYFIPHWSMVVLAVLISALFIYLGTWQLQRAEEKRVMLAAFQHLTKQPPLVWQVSMKPKQYQRILVKGHYLSQNFLLDNQHYDHQFGYNILTPFMLNDGKVLLIDRGWVKGDLNRHNLPTISFPQGSLQLIGQVYYPSSKNWVLGQVLEEKNPNLIITEQIDVLQISQFLHKSIVPFIIRLDKLAENGYLREWKVVAMSPARHKAYALQWFAMAFAIWLIFIGLNLKKING
jgi:surfeit locus 1 family protein